MIHVKIRKSRKTLERKLNKPIECGEFLLPVQRPAALIREAPIFCRRDTKQIFEPSVAYEWITLEIEEDISIGRGGEPEESFPRLAQKHFEFRCAFRPRFELNAGLLANPGIAFPSSARWAKRNRDGKLRQSLQGRDALSR